MVAASQVKPLMPDGRRVEHPMHDPLPALVTTRKTGDETLHFNGQALPADMLAFWQWSASDLVSNVTRGVLAEFIVATALDVNITGTRNDWDAFDLTTPSGTKIEVKSAAYLQTWFQSAPSNIVFHTPLTRATDPSTNRMDSESRRQADVYVLALLHHDDKATVDPLNLAQWSFFVVPTCRLDSRKRSQHSITLRSLQALVSSVQYSELAAAVIHAGDAQRASAPPTIFNRRNP